MQRTLKTLSREFGKLPEAQRNEVQESITPALSRVSAEMEDIRRVIALAQQENSGSWRQFGNQLHFTLARMRTSYDEAEASKARSD